MSSTLLERAAIGPWRDPLSDFVLDERHLATEPPEARGLPRDHVRLMVSDGDAAPVHSRFDRLASFLEPGDLVVVNNSGTRAAAIDARRESGGDSDLVIHVSTELPGGIWMIEPRQRIANGSTSPLAIANEQDVILAGGTRLRLLRRLPGSNRLWLGSVDDDVDLLDVLASHGRAIRYQYVTRDWPLDAYQTVFALERASAEMPSAARPFTAEVVASLVRRGVGLATITLHTGVSSLEGHEAPYPERYDVPSATAAAINTTHGIGRRVVAIGTTVVRALETAVDEQGVVHPAHGWTDVVITPARVVRSVDGLVTGWHEPGASHLAMLEAIAGRAPLVTAYRAAIDNGYLWHEFGDSHLLLRAPHGGR